MSDTTLTDEQREAKGKEMENLENSMISAIKAGITRTITNRGCTPAEAEHTTTWMWQTSTR